MKRHSSDKSSNIQDQEDSALYEEENDLLKKLEQVRTQLARYHYFNFNLLLISFVFSLFCLFIFYIILLRREFFIEKTSASKNPIIFSLSSFFLFLFFLTIGSRYKVPPYVIAMNQTLQQIAKKKPQSIREFRGIVLIFLFKKLCFQIQQIFIYVFS